MSVVRTCLPCRVAKAKVCHLIDMSLFMLTVDCSVIVFVPFVAVARNEA